VNRKNLTAVAVAIVVITSCIVVAGTTRGKTGLIDDATFNGGRIEVFGVVVEEGTGRDGPAETGYLGFTVRGPDATVDYDAIEVSGNFNEFFGVEGTPADTNYTVTLWAVRVVDCGCSYCEKNGYHLEGRLDSETGTIPER